MQPGIFAKTFPRADFADACAAARGHGLECVQFNFSCVGRPTLPGRVEPELVRRIRNALKGEPLSMAAVSGTCNLIHPDEAQRGQDLAKLQDLIACCGELGTTVVTLCTGTRDPVDMWRAHPENHAPEAWRDLLRSLERLLPAANENQVCLGIEPEPANVIDSARKARKLLDELKSPRLKIIFDAANLLSRQTIDRQNAILNEAVELLGSDTVVAHAKDLSREGSIVAAGRGALDYGLYLSLLQGAGFDGPLVLHSLREEEVPDAVAFLQARLSQLPKAATRSNETGIAD